MNRRIWVALFVLVAVAALTISTLADDATARATWSAHESPTGLFTRFRGAPTDPVPAAVAFEAREKCPRLTSATLRQVNPEVYRLEVQGEYLPRVTRIQAVLSTGALADVRFKRPDATHLTVPLFCTDCEIFFGFDWEDRPVACSGPGYHVTLRQAALVE